MPQKVKVTTDDGKSVMLTLDDDAQASQGPAPRPTNAPIAAAWQGATSIGPPTGKRGIFGTSLPSGPDPELHRTDATVGGMPPELAIAGGLPIARAVAAPALSGAERVMAGLKAATATAAPVVKYEVIKGTLQHLGVPAPLAMGAAMMASGYRSGAKAAPAATAPLTTAAEAPMSDAAYEAIAGHPRPGISAPAPAIQPPAPSVQAPVMPAIAPYQQAIRDAKAAVAAQAPAPAVRAAGPGVASAASSPSQLANAIAIEARRAGVSLTADNEKLAMQLVQRGATPQQAIAAFAKSSAPASSAAAEFAARFGTPTDAQAQAQIASRQYKR